MWTDSIVRARFVEAIDTERRMPGAGGRSKGGFWPEYMHSFEDMNGWGTKRLAEEREMRMQRIPPSAAAISRHAEVMDWTARLIHDERRRRIVWAWATCNYHGSSFAERCRREGWVKMTAYRRLGAVFQDIARILNNDRVLLTMPDDRWVLPKTPNTGSSFDMAGEERETPRSPTSVILDGAKPALNMPADPDAFAKHLEQTNRQRRREQERRRKLGMDAA